jgi:hypothetical protein
MVKMESLKSLMFLFGTISASELFRNGVRPMIKSIKQFNVKQAASSLMLCPSGIGLTILDGAVLRRYEK